MQLIPYFFTIFFFFFFLCFGSFFFINYNKLFFSKAFDLLQFNFINLLFFTIFFFPIESSIFNILESWSSKSYLITIVTATLAVLSIYMLKKNYFIFSSSNILIFFFLYISFFGIFSIFYVNDYILFILLADLITMPTFFLIFFNKNTLQIFSAFKYLIINSVGTILFAYFFSIIIFLYGVTSFDELFIFFQKSFAASNSYLDFSFYVFIIAVFLKFGTFPFQFWVLDIYKNSTLFALIYISTFAKFGFVVILSEFFCSLKFSGTYFIAFFLLISVFYSSLSLFRVRVLTFRILIAYSSINNTSLLLLALIFFDFSIAFLFLVNYTAIIIFLVKTFADLRSQKFNEISTFSNGNTIIQAKPFSFELAGLAFILLSGLPPFGIFFAKIYIFSEFLNLGIFSSTFNFIIACFFSFSNFAFIYAYFNFFFLEWFTNPKSFQIRLLTYTFSFKRKAGFWWWSFTEVLSSILIFFIASFSSLIYYLFSNLIICVHTCFQLLKLNYNK